MLILVAAPLFCPSSKVEESIVGTPCAANLAFISSNTACFVMAGAGDEKLNRGAPVEVDGAPNTNGAGAGSLVGVGGARESRGGAREARGGRGFVVLDELDASNPKPPGMSTSEPWSSSGTCGNSGYKDSFPPNIFLDGLNSPISKSNVVLNGLNCGVPNESLTAFEDTRRIVVVFPGAAEFLNGVFGTAESDNRASGSAGTPGREACPGTWWGWGGGSRVERTKWSACGRSFSREGGMEEYGIDRWANSSFAGGAGGGAGLEVAFLNPKEFVRAFSERLDAVMMDTVNKSDKVVMVKGDLTL